VTTVHTPTAAAPAAPALIPAPSRRPTPGDRPVAAPGTGDRYAHKWIIALGVTLAAVMELIDTSIVNVALTQMSANLGATLDEIAWVSTGYILAAVIVLPMTGWFSSYFGRKRYFTASILLFTVASFLCGQSSSLAELVIWRVVQGLGGGALIATSQAILFESFPPHEQTMAAAIFGIGMMVGPAMGPTLGGLIVDRYTWPWIFYINLPFGVMAAIMTWTFVRDSASQQRAQRIDLIGILLIITGIGSLQFVLERGEHYEWFDSTLIRTLTGLACVGLLLLVWWELWVKEPILDLRVLKDKSLAGGSAFAAILGLALYGSIFAVPIYVQQLLGYDAWTAGWILFPGAIGSALAMFGIARFGSRIPDLRILVFAGGVLLVVSMHMHARFTTESGRGDMLWPITLRGFATGCMFVPLATSAMGSLKGRSMAQGTAIFNLTRQLGGSIGIAILANELTRRSALHRASLVEHLVVGDPTTQARLTAITNGLVARGTAAYVAQMQALRVLEVTVQRQATMLAFRDIFLLVGMIMLASLPLILLLRKPARGSMHMGE
jgi:DHA2 family multidrug resistance protein